MWMTIFGVLIVVIMAVMSVYSLYTGLPKLFA
jgi:hypothetical protein